MDVGTLIVGALIGAVPSYFIGRHFERRSMKELRTELQRQTNDLGAKATLIRFERKLRTSKWRSAYISGCETWICDDDGTFQMVIGDIEGTFEEEWMKKFSKFVGSKLRLELKVQGNVIGIYTFISADEGRYTLPLPELAVDESNNPTYFWNPDSLEYVAAEVIGNFYRYSSLREVANLTKIKLHHVRKNA